MASDGDRLANLLAAIDERWLWKRFFQTIARRPTGVSDTMKAAWLRIWMKDGDGIRDKIGHDAVLIGGLRALLPTYRGKAVTLYRGDSMWNRKRRTYGLSWSAKRDVADSFARGVWRSFDGGSVLLKTTASPNAVICCVGDEYGEEEYLVDRRALTRVNIVARYSQQAA